MKAEPQRQLGKPPYTIEYAPSADHPCEYAWIRDADGVLIHSPLGMNPADAELYVAMRHALAGIRDVAAFMAAMRTMSNTIITVLATCVDAKAFQEFGGTVIDEQDSLLLNAALAALDAALNGSQP